MPSAASSSGTRAADRLGASPTAPGGTRALKPATTVVGGDAVTLDLRRLLGRPRVASRATGSASRLALRSTLLAEERSLGRGARPPPARQARSRSASPRSPGH